MSIEQSEGKVPVGHGDPTYESAKKEVNEGGFEGDEKGGADVFVGKKEDVERMRKQRENEGRTESLDTYIRLHGEVVAPKEFVKGFLKERQINFENLKPGDYGIAKLDNYSMFRMWFLDRNLDLKKVNIDTRKISEIENPQRLHIFLGDLGFKDIRGFDAANKFGDCSMAYIQEMERQEDSATKKRFDF